MMRSITKGVQSIPKEPSSDKPMKRAFGVEHRPAEKGDQTTRWAAALAVGWAWSLAVSAVELPVKPAMQEQTYWCWAACAEMIIEYLDPGKNVEQCDLAVIEYGLEDYANCCNESDPLWAECNLGGAFPDWSFAEHEVDYTPSASRLSLKKIKAQIDQNRPLLYSWYWNKSEGTGHMVVLNGYAKQGSKNILYCLDPNARPEIGTESYMFFHDDYQNRTHWETWYDIQPTGEE